MSDTELRRIEELQRVLETLEPEARRRALHYLIDRNGAAFAERERAIAGRPLGADPLRQTLATAVICATCKHPLDGPPAAWVNGGPLCNDCRDAAMPEPDLASTNGNDGDQEPDGAPETDAERTEAAYAARRESHG